MVQMEGKDHIVIDLNQFGNGLARKKAINIHEVPTDLSWLFSKPLSFTLSDEKGLLIKSTALMTNYKSRWESNTGKRHV
ncbi:hypothetical protein SLEP1_g58890 [Rubroshorea leprosula]|uniref:Uncharacterized protein n=1 Tax=Rubroshorea leprosula TaxID=152421 RepID=A0AAV5MQV3_9ROSI|nr:hypothetical protein SLEP1_g58890 [Rubroshorea leprosula]